MALPGHSPSSLRGCGGQERFLITGKKQMSLLISGRVRLRCGELQAGQSHLDPWEGDGATNPGNIFQRHEGQDDDRE